MSNLTLITLAWGSSTSKESRKARIAGRLVFKTPGDHPLVAMWYPAGGAEEAGQPCRETRGVGHRGTGVRMLWAEDACPVHAEVLLLPGAMRQHGVHLSVPKIYEILRERYVIRSKWKKRRRREPVPVASGPSQVVQMDTVMFGSLFAFTVIDIYTKEADILVAPASGPGPHGCLWVCLSRAGHGAALQWLGGVDSNGRRQ